MMTMGTMDYWGLRILPGAELDSNNCRWPCQRGSRWQLKFTVSAHQKGTL